MKIISGGQSGVDRAALDVALELGIPCGGWCPQGRRAEDGVIASKYPLEQTPLVQYQQRTEWNARDSDGTLILTIGKPEGGTLLTIDFARKHKRPCLVVDLVLPVDAQAVKDWILSHQIESLNVAGPRASKQPDAYGRAVVMLKSIFSNIGVLQEPHNPKEP